MSYKLTAGWPIHLDSGAFVNPDTNEAFRAWIAGGNTPEPADPPPPPDPHAEVLGVSMMALASGIFIPLSLKFLSDSIQAAISIGATLTPPLTLTIEEAEAMLLDANGPYYNDTFAKITAYVAAMEAARDV